MYLYVYYSICLYPVLYARIYVYVCMYVYACMHVYARILVSVCMYVYVCICTYLCIFIYVCICVYACICQYFCNWIQEIQTYTYVYIQYVHIRIYRHIRKVRILQYIFTIYCNIWYPNPYTCIYWCAGSLMRRTRATSSEGDSATQRGSLQGSLGGAQRNVREADQVTKVAMLRNRFGCVITEYAAADFPRRPISWQVALWNYQQRQACESVSLWELKKFEISRLR